MVPDLSSLLCLQVAAGAAAAASDAQVRSGGENEGEGAHENPGQQQSSTAQHNVASAQADLSTGVAADGGQAKQSVHADSNPAGSGHNGDATAASGSSEAARGGGDSIRSSSTNASSNGKGSGTSGSGGTQKKVPMQDCSTDDSGLPLASLKVEAAWESHGLREGTDITIVTQMSPQR